jgi:hypothetical protein
LIEFQLSLSSANRWANQMGKSNFGGQAQDLCIEVWEEQGS